jgi:hypothetical protein
MEGIVQPQFAVSDRIVKLPLASVDVVRRKIVVTEPDDNSGSVLAASSTYDGVSVRLTREGAKQVALYIVASPMSVRPNMVGNVVIKTSSHVAPELRLPIRAEESSTQ